MDELFTRKLSSRIADKLSETNDYEEAKPRKNDTLTNLMNRNVRRNTFEKRYMTSDVKEKE